MRTDLDFVQLLIHFIPDVVESVLGEPSIGHKNRLEVFGEGKFLAVAVSFPGARSLGGIIISLRQVSRSLVL